jgi:GT2 family glycosyltransferase
MSGGSKAYRGVGETGNVRAVLPGDGGLSVATVNYNSEVVLRRLVESLNSIGCVERLVVVDHSASPYLQTLEADFPIKIIHQPNKGYGAGLNRGLRELRDSQGLILLCNPDIVILTHERIGDVWRYMRDHPDVGLVIPSLVDAHMRPMSSCRKFYSLRSLLLVSNSRLRKLMPIFCEDHYYGFRCGTEPLEVDWGSGAAMFVRASEARKGPLFDERFFLYFEDVDVCARMWRENRSIVHFPDLVCQHFESRLSHQNVRHFITHLTSLLKFIIKYRGLPQKGSLQPPPRFVAPLEKDFMQTPTVQSPKSPMEEGLLAMMEKPRRG